MGTASNRSVHAAHVGEWCRPCHVGNPPFGEGAIRGNQVCPESRPDLGGHAIPNSHWTQVLLDTGLEQAVVWTGLCSAAIT